MEGEWEYYDYGVLTHKGIYKDDFKVGLWEWYYSSGKLMIKEYYDN